MTNGKNRKPIIDDAQTLTADVPVAPSVPRGTAMVGDSEDEGTHRMVPSTASTACTEATVNPKEIARQITSLLSNKGIPHRLFSEKVLNRS